MTHWFSGFGFSPVLQIVLTASCQASLLALIILVSQSMMGRWLSPRWRYALWSVVLIRLMMPIAPGSTLSVFNLFRNDPVPTVTVVPQPLVLAAEVIAYSQNTPVRSITASPPVSTWGMDDIALAIWLTGMATFLSVIAAINIALAFRLRHRSDTTDPDLLELLESCKREMGVRRKVLLYDDPKIVSPALAGVFRPSLLIPPSLLTDLPRGELRFILLHELAHVKKHDITQNWLLIVLAAIHWFNPVIWFAFARLRADRELARDAMVLSTTGADANQAYGQTIIHALERITRPNLHNPALAGIGDGMGQLKRRLRMIALAPKRRPTITFIGITLLATLAAIGLTDAAEPEAPATDTETKGLIEGEPRSGLDAGNTSPARMNYELGQREFVAGDDIVISEIIGSRDDFSVGGTYTIKGRYTLRSQDKAMLSAFTTSQNTTGPTRVQPDQTVAVKRGGGSFNLTMTIVDEGYPHISFYPHDGGSSFGGIYFGLGETLKQKAAGPEAQIDQLVEKKLKQAISVTFDQTPLEEVVQAFGDKLGVPIFANWPYMEKAGVDAKMLVTLSLNTVPGDQVLHLVLNQVSESKGLYAPAWRIIDGVVYISLEHDFLRMHADTRVYDLHLLLMAAEVEPPPLAPLTDGTIPERPAKAKPSREELVGQIATLIRETVGYYEEWEANGGDISSVEESSASLTINTSQENHENIVAILGQMTESLQIAINFKSHFFLAPERFAEEAGIELAFKKTPKGDRISFLDDLESGLITQAVRENPLALTLAVPLVLQLDRQEASVTIEQQSAYIVDYKTVVNENGTGVEYEPVVETIAEGINVTMLGAASADMRSINVILHPTVTNVEHPVEKKQWKASPANKELFIDAIKFSTAEKKLELSIPDLATVLIDVGTVSGPMSSSDPAEEGVDRHVYMLIKPTIIIQRKTKENSQSE